MITQPYINFIQPDAGGNVKPVSKGKIYIGKEGLDPKLGGNPIYYRDNQGVEKEISNPIYLNMTGVPVAGPNSDKIINPYTKKPISIFIENQNGGEVYSELLDISNFIYKEEIYDAIAKLYELNFVGVWEPNKTYTLNSNEALYVESEGLLIKLRSGTTHTTESSWPADEDNWFTNIQLDLQKQCNVIGFGAKGAPNDDTEAFKLAVSKCGNAYVPKSNSGWVINEDVTELHGYTDQIFTGTGNVDYKDLGKVTYKRATDYKKTLQERQNISIACFGDSTMWGATPFDLGTKDPNNQPASLSLALNTCYFTSIKAANFAISGSTLRQMISGTGNYPSPFAVQLRTGQAKNYDVIYCNHCINDSQLDLDETQYRKDLEMFVSVCRLENKTPILVTPNPNPSLLIISIEKSKRLESYVNIMRNVAETMDVDLVDNYKYLLRTNTKVAMDVIVPDGAHPSSRAYLQCGFNLAIPFVSARTMRDVGDVVGLSNVSWFSNSTNSSLRNGESRVGLSFLCTREAGLTGINYPFLLEYPQESISVIGGNWSNGAEVDFKLNLSQVQAANFKKNLGNTAYVNWSNEYLYKCDAWAGLSIFSLLFDMTPTAGSGTDFVFSGLTISEEQFSTYRSPSINENRTMYMTTGKALSVNNFNLTATTPLTIYDVDVAHPGVGEKVQEITFSGGAIKSTVYNNFGAVQEIQIATGKSAGLHDIEIVWGGTGVIIVKVGPDTANHSAYSLPNSAPMFYKNVTISNVAGNKF